MPVLEEPGSKPLAPEHINPRDSAAFVIVAAVDDATVNALNYARALHAFKTRALYFALHPQAAGRVRRAWKRRQLPIPLEVVDCPFRELADPLLDHLRHVTQHRNGIAAVNLPELVTGGPLHALLHDRQALYLKWLLLFEPRVVLSSVPYLI